VLDGYINSNILTFTQRYGEQKKFCKITALWFRIYPKQTDSVRCTVATAAGTFDFYFPPFRENQHIFVDIPGRMFSSSEKRNAGKISFLS